MFTQEQPQIKTHAQGEHEIPSSFSSTSVTQRNMKSHSILHRKIGLLLPTNSIINSLPLTLGHDHLIKLRALTRLCPHQDRPAFTVDLQYIVYQPIAPITQVN